MRRFTTSIVLAGAALLSAGVAATSTAQAKPRRHHPVVAFYDPRPPITVRKRSWLEPGPVVPVGSMSNYVTANTIFNRTPDQVFARSYFGNEALPRPLEVPGRPEPLIIFTTPRDPF
jgi:hypothetical protein